MGIKDFFNKLKPKDQECFSVEIEDSKDVKEEKDEKKENNKCC